jgi:hypothetical protein
MLVGGACIYRRYLWYLYVIPLTDCREPALDLNGAHTSVD